MSYPHNVGQSTFLHDITLTHSPNSNSNSNSNSKEQQQVEEDPHHHHLPLSLCYFPSPFEDDDVLLFQQHHQYLNLLSPHDSQLPPLTMREATCGAENTALADDHQTKIKMVDWDSNNNHDKKSADHHHGQQIPRRRSSKRDRHSKINTARGPRDRRMRLSLEVARKFFGLQDVLGFDKASKTVEWLIGKAEPEIKKLARDQLNIIVRCSDKRSTTSPATSESGEVVSGIDEAVVPNIVNDGEELRSSQKDQRKLGRKKLLRKRTFRPLAKASREKARARARERTLREQMKRGSKKPCEEEISGVTQVHNNSTNYITTTITTHHDSISLDPHNHEDDHRDYDPLVIMGKWSPSTILTSLQQNTGIIPQEHNQFADFQFYGKQPWEVYNNNHNLF